MLLITQDSGCQKPFKRKISYEGRYPQCYIVIVALAESGEERYV